MSLSHCVRAWAVAGFALASVAQNEVDDFQAGIAFPRATHVYLKLPNGIEPDSRENVQEYSGTYQGGSSYSGDRRYEAFRREYKVEVRVGPSAEAAIKWGCREQNEGVDAWRSETPPMTVQNVKLRSGVLWGDMSYISRSDEKIVARPFLAQFAKRCSDNVPGLVLFGQYEGDILLPRLQ